MAVRDVTLSEAGRFRSAAEAGDLAVEMDEEAFRALYDRTARALWVYLSRVTGSSQRADDLLQETYYRFLRAGSSHENDAHRRNSLFRIATNLVRDQRRRRQPDLVSLAAGDHDALADQAAGSAERAARRTDLSRAMQRLKPRDRAMLWLAYAEGSSHREIAQALGVRPGSMKQLLFRARRRLATLLGGAGGRP